MRYFVIVLLLAIAVSFTITNAYAAQQFQSPVTILSTTVTPVIEFRDQGSKAFFLQIPDNSKRFEIFDNSNDKTRFAITNAGNIGIGTTAPISLLDLRKASPTLRIESSAGDSEVIIRAAGGNPTLTFADAASSAYELRIDDGTKKFQLVRVNTDSPLITIENNGNVGIGTITPAEKLDVAGNIKLSGNIVSDGDICIGAC